MSDLRVDGEGYGKVMLGGILCAVMPFRALHPDQIQRVDQGAQPRLEEKTCQHCGHQGYTHQLQRPEQKFCIRVTCQCLNFEEE